MDLCKCCVLHVRLLTFTGLSVVPNKRCARRRHMVARMNSVWCPPSTSTIKASHKWHSGIADDLWVDFELCKCKYIQVQKLVKNIFVNSIWSLWAVWKVGHAQKYWQWHVQQYWTCVLALIILFLELLFVLWFVILFVDLTLRFQICYFDLVVRCC